MTDNRPILTLKKNPQPKPIQLADNEVLIESTKLKVTLPLKPEQLPESVLPPVGKTGNVLISIQLNDSNGKPFVVKATLNSKNYRKIIKTIKEKQSDNQEVIVLFQGDLTANRTIEGAGLSVQVKQPKPVTVANP